MFNKNTWKHLNVCKQMNSNKLIRNKVAEKLFAYKSYEKTGFDIK